jgi:hypothetical protein
LAGNGWSSGRFLAAWLIVYVDNKAGFLFRLCRVSRFALRDGRHMVPSLSAEPKNLAVIAKRIYLTGIGSDLNDLPCHASPRAVAESRNATILAPPSSGVFSCVPSKGERRSCEAPPYPDFAPCRKMGGRNATRSRQLGHTSAPMVAHFKQPQDVSPLLFHGTEAASTAPTRNRSAPREASMARKMSPTR